MATRKKYIFFLTLILAYKSTESAKLAGAVLSRKITLDDLSDIWDGVTGIFEVAKYLWSGVENSKVLERHSSDDEVASPIAEFVSDEKKEIEQLLKFIQNQGDELITDIHTVKDVLQDKLASNVAALRELDQRLSDVYLYIYKIDNKYNSFLEYVTNPSDYDMELLSKFAKDIVSPGACGLKHDIVKLDAYLIGHESALGVKSTLDLLVEHYKLFSEYVEINQSQQQLLYSILTKVLWTDLKAYLVLRYAYAILTIHENKNFDSHVKKSENEFKERVSKTLKAFKEAMNSASSVFYRKDPAQHVEGVTYTRLKRLFSMILLNQMDVNQNDKCSGYCHESMYKLGNFLNKNCYYEEGICRDQKTCDGDIVSCNYGIENNMQVCLNTKNNDDRRYDYVIDNDNKWFGAAKRCEGRMSSAASYRLAVTWGRRCDFCTCVCSEKKNSDRFFSLQEVKSRYKENYVITGVRFVKQKNIIHIQIQEGQFQPAGTINASTIRWVPLPEKPDKVHTVEYNKNNKIDLVQLLVPYKSQVIVGIKFNSINGKSSSDSKHLSLSISALDVDHMKGKVLSDSPPTKISLPYCKKAVNVRDPDLPTRFKEKNTERVTSDFHVNIAMTGLIADIQQNVIPFIDTQDIVTTPTAPISGVGVYLRKIKNSGGFLALSTSTYDYAYNLNPDYKPVDDHQAFNEDFYDYGGYVDTSGFYAGKQKK